MSQEIVNTLKIRVFDAEEALRAEREQINTFMQQLIQALNVKAENGQVTLESIISRAQKLVAMEEMDESETAEVKETKDA